LLILQILKIAGIVLLCLLGLVLLLIILLLVLPWRYRVTGNLREKQYEAEIKVSWMLKAVYLRQYVNSGEEAGGTLRIFGLRLFRSNKEIQEEQMRLQEERKPDPEVMRQVGSSTSLFEDPVQNDLEQYQSDIPNAPMEEKTVPEPEEMPERQTIRFSSIRQMWKEGRAPQPEELLHLAEVKLEELIQKAIEFSDREAKVIIRKSKTYLEALIDGSVQSLEKLKELKELIFGPKYQKEVQMVMKEVRRILHQILPRKGNGMLVFGLGDPYYTGKLLEFLAFLYPMYGETVKVCPYFDDKKLEADADIRGHIFLIVPLVSFIKIWFNKRIRFMYSEFMRINTNEHQK